MKRKFRLPFLILLLFFIFSIVLPSKNTATAELSIPNYSWTKTVGSTSSDASYSLALDSNANVYVAGTFTDTVDFDPGAGTDNQTSAGSTGVFLSKYNADGSYAWTKTFGGTYSDYAKGIAVDSGGNVYVTGTFYFDTVDFDPGAGTDNHTPVGERDVFLSKYASNGSYFWTKTIGGSNFDFSTGVATDNDGNVFITGFFPGTVDFDPSAGTDNHIAVGVDDIFLSKYSSDGSYAWTKTVGGAGNESSENITTDNNGNVFITGVFVDTVDFDPGAGTDNHTGELNGQDIFVSKYNADGSYAWTSTFGADNSYDYSNGIATDSGGNVFITGTFESTVDFDPGAGTDNHTAVGSNDIFLTKYLTNGSHAWTKTVGGTDYEEAYGISSDTNDNLYITGNFENTVDFDPGAGTDNHTASGALPDIFLSKYNSDGSYAWAVSLGSTGSEYSFDTSIDSGNNVYISGYFPGTVDFDPGAGTDNHTSAGSSDIFLSKYTQTFLQQVNNLPAGVSATTTSGTDITSSSGVSTGDNITVTLLTTGASTIIADVGATFGSDLDWSSVLLGTDTTTGKTFVHNLGSAPGTAGTFTLYVPYISGHSNVGICPNATSLSEVTDSCTGLYYLSEADSNVTLSTIDGQQYWIITGLSSTGGFSVLGLADTGQNTDHLQVIALLFISFGAAALLSYLKDSRFTKI